MLGEKSASSCVGQAERGRWRACSLAMTKRCKWSSCQCAAHANLWSSSAPGSSSSSGSGDMDAVITAWATCCQTSRARTTWMKRKPDSYRMQSASREGACCTEAVLLLQEGCGCHGAVQHQVNAPTRSRNEKGSRPLRACWLRWSHGCCPCNIFTATCGGSNIVYTPTRLPCAPPATCI